MKIALKIALGVAILAGVFTFVDDRIDSAVKGALKAQQDTHDRELGRVVKIMSKYGIRISAVEQGWEKVRDMQLAKRPQITITPGSG